MEPAWTRAPRGTRWVRRRNIVSISGRPSRSFKPAWSCTSRAILSVSALTARGHRPPRREGPAGARQHSSKFRAVPQNDTRHAILGDPVHAEGRIDFGTEIDREKAVALEAARRHEDEDTEGGVGEAETGRTLLGKQTHHGVDLV